VCLGGEGISTRGCETLSREAFAIEGHEASATQAHNQPAEVASVWAAEIAMCATIMSPEKRDLHRTVMLSILFCLYYSCYLLPLLHTLFSILGLY